MTIDTLLRDLATEEQTHAQDIADARDKLATELAELVAGITLGTAAKAAAVRLREVAAAMATDAATIQGMAATVRQYADARPKADALPAYERNADDARKAADDHALETATIIAGLKAKGRAMAENGTLTARDADELLSEQGKVPVRRTADQAKLDQVKRATRAALADARAAAGTVAQLRAAYPKLTAAADQIIGVSR